MFRIIALCFLVALAAAISGAFLRSLAPTFGEADISRFVSFLPENGGKASPTPPFKKQIAGGVVPHHLLAKEIIEKFFKALSEENQPETIVILSPDHFNAANALGYSKFIAPAPFGEKIDDLALDGELLENLYNAGILVPGESFMALEHGITVLLPFIKKYFPESRVVPLVVPFALGLETAEILAKIIEAQETKNAIIIASVDFSHYLPESAAYLHDVKSISALINFQKEKFEKLDVDCWQCLYALRRLAESRGAEYPEVIAHKNSVDFWQSEPPEETTSYFSVIFKKANGVTTEERCCGAAEFDGRSVIFTGDIMLGRHIEYLMKKNGFTYPFEKIKPFFAGVDIVFGNLEGPISANPQKFPADSLKFSFSPAAAEALSFAGITLISLANNHSLDTGQQGLAETRDILKKSGIGFVGDPLKCGAELAYRSENLIFLAFNKTWPFICPEEEISRTIKTLKQSAPESYIAVSVHWGNEYQPKSSPDQQRQARLMIDVGADAIFGHHPHVIQEIEIYRNKPIFYSLGNFVFDQYFSKETQEGLAVGAEIFPDRTTYRLFPVKIQAGQPILMAGKEKQSFLEKLALKSAPDLARFIKDGKMELRF